MVSNQTLQNTLEGLKSITRRDFSVLERDGKVVATTQPDLLHSNLDGVGDFMQNPAESQVVMGYQYFKVFDNGIAEYVVMIKGEDEETYRIGKIAAFQIQGLIIAYKERFDRDNFVKNLLLDNLLLVDIYSRAKKLRIENNVRRVVYVVEARTDDDAGMVEIMRNIFPSKNRDFVTVVDQEHIILAKELKSTDKHDAITAYANTICDTLSAEAMEPVCVGIGTVVDDLKHVSRSFKEAKMALEVGKIFDEKALVVNYENLGVGRLIYQLPMSLCRMFVNEVLRGFTSDVLDEEALVTIDKFFENNLNVSETARQLYIHRNTLVYRLDKLQKLTGLDLRNFDDAIIFKITLMVGKYMRHKDQHLY